MPHGKTTRTFAVPCPSAVAPGLPCVSLTVPGSEPPTRPSAGTMGSELAPPLPFPLPHGLGRRWHREGNPLSRLSRDPPPFLSHAVGGVSLSQISIWGLCFHESQRQCLQRCRTQSSPFISNTVKMSSFVYDPIIPAVKLSAWFSLESGAPYL